MGKNSIRKGCAKMESAYPGMECELPSLSTLLTVNGDGAGVHIDYFFIFFNSISQRYEEHQPVFFKFFNLV